MVGGSVKVVEEVFTIPKYDYKCDTCVFVFEVEHPMADTMDFHECIDEDCTGLLHRVFTAVPGHFKGGGWGKVYGKHNPRRS